MAPSLSGSPFGNLAVAVSPLRALTYSYQFDTAINSAMRNPFNPAKTKTLFQIALGGYWLLIFTGTHLPPTTSFLPYAEHNVDKVYHFTAYAILAGLLATVWQLSSGVLTARHLRWTWIAVVIYGALDEITQIPVSRDCDFWDWTADAIGAAAGLFAFVWLRRRFMNRTTEDQ